MFKLKEWIANISELANALHMLGSASAYSVAANSNTIITLPNATRALLVVCGAGNSKLVAVVNTTAAGSATHLIVAQGSSGIDLTDGTNQITINNNINASSRALLIDFAQHSVI